MRKLPHLIKITPRETIVTSFGPLSEKVEKEGYIKDIKNITGENYPLLSSRAPYKKVADGYTLLGAIKNTPYQVRKVGKAVHFYDGENAIFPLTDTKKQMVMVSGKVIIFPDKKYYSLTAKKAKGTFSSLMELNNQTPTLDVRVGDVYLVGESPKKVFCYVGGGAITELQREPLHPAKVSAWDFVSYEFGDLSLAGEIADSKDAKDSIKYNSVNGAHIYNEIILRKSFDAFYDIRVGDFIYIKSKSVSDGEVEKKEILVKITEISSEIEIVRFIVDYNFNNIKINKLTELKFERRVPDFSHILSEGERLIGVADETIYISKLSEPHAFFDYSLTADSAYTVKVAGADFTGAYCYNSRPTFFTENAVYKLYGKVPSEFSLVAETGIYGVKKGLHPSLTEVGGVLYYIGEEGLMSYSGTFPKKMSDAVTLTGGTAISDGDDYLICEGERFIRYDTRRNMYFIEEGEITHGTAFIKNGGVKFCNPQGVYELKGGDEEVESLIEFHPFYDDTLSKKGVMKIRVRAFVAGTANAYLTENGERIPLGELNDGVSVFTLNKRMAEYGLIITAKGDFTLKAIERIRRKGSDEN